MPLMKADASGYCVRPKNSFVVSILPDNRLMGIFDRKSCLSTTTLSTNSNLAVAGSNSRNSAFSGVTRFAATAVGLAGTFRPFGFVCAPTERGKSSHTIKRLITVFFIEFRSLCVTKISKKIIMMKLYWDFRASYHNLS